MKKNRKSKDNRPRKNRGSWKLMEMMEEKGKHFRGEILPRYPLLFNVYLGTFRK